MNKLHSKRSIYPTWLTAGLALSLIGLGLTGTVQASMMITEATANTVTLSWESPGDDGVNGTATEYDFRYSTSVITEANWNSAAQVTNEPTPLPAGATQTMLVSGLTPNTAYYFAARSADEVPNWSELSCVVMRSTLSSGDDVKPPMAIGDLQAVVSAPAASPESSQTNTNPEEKD